MSEEIDRWIRYMQEHPRTWKKIHTAFINAQFLKQQAFVRRLIQEPNGKERVIAAYGIKNVKGSEKLLM